MRVGGIGRILLFTTIILAVATVAIQAKYITMDLIIDTDNETPINVFINGISLNDKIDQLEKDVQDLYNRLSSITITIYDYLIFNEYRARLQSVYDNAFYALYSKLLLTNKTEEKEEIIGKIAEILKKKKMLEKMEDSMLMKLLTDLRKGEEVVSYPELGWWDIYNEHHGFEDTDLKPYEPVDFRLTDCYSEIGKSHVVRGGDIVIEGVIYRYGVVGNDRIKVYLTDPESGEKERLIVVSEIGYNKTLDNVKVEWLTPTVFRITIDTKDMSPGLKKVTVKFEDYKVYCTFKVLEPYIKAEKVGRFVVVYTNIPAISVKYNGTVQTYKVPNHHIYVYVGNVTKVTVEGANDYNFVRVVLEN